MVKKCRNDVPTYGYDSQKINSVMAHFVRGESAPTCSCHTVLQAAAYRVKDVCGPLRSILKKTDFYMFL